MNNPYWSNLRGMSVDAYVQRFVEASDVDRERMRETEALLPMDISSLLDVGCGYGHFLRVVRDRRGLAGIGVEITEEKVRYAREALGIDARVGSVDQLPFPDRSFDAVCALEVIEHLPLIQYQKGRDELSRVAKRWIVISVPWRERRRNTECPSCGCEFNHNYHLRSFGDADFPSLLPDFELRSLAGMGKRFETFAWVQALGKVRRRHLPPFAVCPACGFHSESPMGDTTGAASGAPGTAGLTSRTRNFLRRMAGSSNPCWYLALFERKSGLH